MHKNIPNKQNHKQKQSVLSYQKSQVQLCKRNGGNHQDSHPKIHGRMSNKTDTNSKMSSVVRDGR